LFHPDRSQQQQQQQDDRLTIGGLWLSRVEPFWWLKFWYTPPTSLPHTHLSK
jgi:hypothetical protein